MIRTLTALVATLTVVSTAGADDIDQIFNEVGNETIVAGDTCGGGAPCGEYCDSGCGTCGDCCCDVSCWFARGDVVWLRRTRSDNHNLTQSGSGNNEFLLHTDKLEFDYEPGFRVVVGRHMNACTSIEASYLRVDEFSSDAEVRGNPTNLEPYWNDSDTSGAGGFNINNFDNANLHSARYESQLHNVELNVRHYRCDNTSVLFGARYINIDEDFRFLAIDQPNAAPGTELGIYDIHTSNDLFGFQVGAQRDWGMMDDSLVMHVQGKAGILVNVMDTHNHLFDNQDGQGVPRTNDRRGESGERFSTVVEIGVGGRWNVTDHIAVRGGYDVFFISGLALAPEQLDAGPAERNARRKLNDNGVTIYHGPSVGAEVTW